MAHPQPGRASAPALFRPHPVASCFLPQQDGTEYKVIQTALAVNVRTFGEREYRGAARIIVTEPSQDAPVAATHFVSEQPRNSRACMIWSCM